MGTVEVETPLPVGDPRPPRRALPRFSKPMTWLVKIAAVLLAAGGVVLLLDAGRRALAPPTAREILERVKAEAIPAENTPANYDVAFNVAGYQTLLEWSQSYPVAPEWAADFESLNLTLPCCGFTSPSADETKNCGCGHHRALYGLSKRLLADGYSAAETQAEVNRWVAYLFPRETLAAELERRALIDPEINRALQEFKENGEC